jgi:hypothetical protein
MGRGTSPDGQALSTIMADIGTGDGGGSSLEPPLSTLETSPFNEGRWQKLAVFSFQKWYTSERRPRPI